jgi:tetratricopeptide (TPR) repeat protein
LGVFASLLCLALLWAAPAGAAWRRAESPNFILYGNLPEAELRQRILQLEDFDHLLRLMIAVTAPPTPNKLHVYIVGNGRDLRTVQQVPTGIAGFYTATPDGIAAVIDNSEESNGNEILFHEYSHHFMMQYRPNAYPAWYVEGFAEYFMTAHFDPHRIDIGNYSPGRAYLIVQGQWLPMEQILNGDPQSLRGDALGQFYAQAWLTTHYFFSTTERQAALGRYLVALRGDNPAGALQAATGMDAAAFTQELRRYIGHGQISFRRMTRPEGEVPPPVTVTILPRGADDLMIYEAALYIGLSDEQGHIDLPLIRAAAARHEGDPFAQRVLAHAELLYGDAAAADRLLDPLIATNPNDAELLYLKGMRYLVAAEAEDEWEADARTARSWFSRAHQADGNHYQTLFRYSQSLRRDPSYASENNLNVLLLAHQLAPQVSTITMNAAAMLIGNGDYGLAIPLLRPLAADPHNASLAAAAKRMIERANAGAAAHPAPAQGHDQPPQHPN